MNKRRDFLTAAYCLGTQEWVSHLAIFNIRREQTRCVLKHDDNWRKEISQSAKKETIMVQRKRDV